MKIDSVHAEHMLGNAVSSSISSHSIVSRDSAGDIHAAGVSISGSSGTLFSYSDGTRSVYGGCNSDDPWFGTSSNHDLRLVTYSGERMRIDNTGNVGIGTTSPSALLHISSGTDGDCVLRLEADTDNDTETDNARIEFISDGGLNTALVGAGQMPFSSDNDNALVLGAYQTIFYTGVQDFTDSANMLERMRIDEDGNVGIGVTSPTSPLHIVGSDTNANATYSTMVIDHNCSGSDACTADRLHTGLLVDMDSTATGGDTNHEHRMYGIRSDTRHSGDSDIVYGLYSYTKSDHTSGTTTELRAGDFYAIASGTGTNTNIYGINSFAYKDAGSTGTTAKMIGVRGEVQLNGGECTNAYVFQSQIDHNDGTMDTAYLYYGSYSGTVSTKWGIYLTGETKNYFSGDVGIGDTSPSYKLDVNGDINVASGKKFRMNGTALANSAMIAATSSNVASNIVVRDVNGDFSAGTITAALTGNASTASSCSGNAATATALQTARTIGDVNFDGTADIDLPGVNTGGTQDTTGNAATATNADTVDNLHASAFLRTDTTSSTIGSLSVSGSSQIGIGMFWKAEWNYSAYVNDDDYTRYFQVGVYVNRWVRGEGLLASSDERVKRDIQTLDTGMALSKLEKIRPVSYKMKDTGDFMFGFIGQEIEKELPNVVNKADGTITDFNIMGVFSNKQSIKYQAEDEEKDTFIYTLTLEEPIPSTFDVDKAILIEAGTDGHTIQFFYDPEYCGKPEIGGTVMKLLHETELIEEGRYKIIGTETNDFRTLDYNEIFTVTTAALKEVNEQLKAEKIKMATLETKYEELSKRVEAIEAL